METRQPRQFGFEWQEELDIRPGISKEEALEKFRQWQDSKKTCERCQEDEKSYAQCCPLKFVCEEADRKEEASGREITVRERRVRDSKTQEVGLSLNANKGPEMGQGL